jgi:hypothetical protein
MNGSLKADRCAASLQIRATAVTLKSISRVIAGSVLPAARSSFTLARSVITGGLPIAAPRFAGLLHVRGRLIRIFPQALNTAVRTPEEAGGLLGISRLEKL